MSENQKPSIGIDPANATAGLKGTLRHVLWKRFQQMQNMLPCSVIAVDDARQFVTVQPLIMVLGTDGATQSRAQIDKVPIFNIGAGNFVLSFPVMENDLGWIHASDRDISLFIQGMKEAKPNTLRLHSFSDGVFYPDAMRKWVLADEDKANAVWQSFDGTIKITLGMDQIKIAHPTKVLIDTPMMECTGTIWGKTDVLSGDDQISGKGHTHGGVATGSGHTGEPDA